MNNAERCPACDGPMDKVIGPAEETKYGVKYLHVLEVLRCRNCNHNEVLCNINSSLELNRLWSTLGQRKVQ